MHHRHERDHLLPISAHTSLALTPETEAWLKAWREQRRWYRRLWKGCTGLWQQLKKMATWWAR